MRWVLAPCLVILLGCVPYVHSPPGRSFPLETSKALYPRETGIQVEGGGTANVDVGAPGFAVRVRHGMVKQLDGSAEFGYQHINTDENVVFANGNRHLVTGRIGLQYEIVEAIAVTGGVAAGTWAGGAFVSPDLSLIIAWENPYVVPFIDGGAYTSHPVRTKTILINETGPLENFIGQPVFTYGWTAGFGFRIPLVRKQQPVTPPAILLGTRVRGAIFDESYRLQGGVDGATRALYWQGSVGFEYVFAPRRTQTN